jgi:hypothetical protein
LGVGTSGACLFTAAALALTLRNQAQGRWPAILIAAGVGHLGFALFRLAFLSFLPGDLVRFAFWEEVTELLIVVALAYVLGVFRLEVSPFPALRRLAE